MNCFLPKCSEINW